MEEDTRKRYGDMYADGCMDSTSSPVLCWCLGTALCPLVTCAHHRPVVPWSSGPHLAAAVSVTQRARGETLAPAQPPETRADRQLAGCGASGPRRTHSPARLSRPAVASRQAANLVSLSTNLDRETSNRWKTRGPA